MAVQYRTVASPLPQRKWAERATGLALARTGRGRFRLQVDRGQSLQRFD